MRAPNPFFSLAKVKAILTAGLVAGTLDILCAIFILAGGNAAGVFRYIARGAFGETALHGGVEMVFLGGVFHYFIALTFTAAYFIVYPFVPILGKQKIISGLLYGIFVWSFMRFIVLPLTFNVPGPVSLAAVWKGIVILMFAVGLPVSFFTAGYYKKRPSS